MRDLGARRLWLALASAVTLLAAGAGCGDTDEHPPLIGDDEGGTPAVGSTGGGSGGSGNGAGGASAGTTGDSPSQPLPDGGPIGVGGVSPGDAGGGSLITTD